MISTSMSRRGFVRGLAAVSGGVASAMPAPLLARAAEPPPSAKSFVEKIYGSYVGSSAQDAKGIPLDNPSTVRRYFTAGLASLILEDAAAAKRRGEPPTLDGDAFVGRQDWDIASLLVDVKESGAKATATVNFTNFDKAEKVVVDLLKVGEAWRIADIAWESGALRGLYRKR